MRRKIIAGNWKMYNNLTETVKLIDELKIKINNETLNCDIIICPPYTSIETAFRSIKDSVIKLGAQNMHFEEKGAFTGEVSADMLKGAGCEFVILGHSERRTIFKENDDLINKKIKKALASGLMPIFCIGETLQEREEGITEKVVNSQIVDGLKDIPAEEMNKIIVAYEPVWAIGTGKTATPEQAQEVHAFIRNLIAKLYSKDIADKLIIQYGGSVKPDNAAQLLSQSDIDGALVGGACLKADSFHAIIKAA